MYALGLFSGIIDRLGVLVRDLWSLAGSLILASNSITVILLLGLLAGGLIGGALYRGDALRSHRWTLSSPITQPSAHRLFPIDEDRVIVGDRSRSGASEDHHVSEPTEMAILEGSLRLIAERLLLVPRVRSPAALEGRPYPAAKSLANRPAPGRSA